WAIVPLLMLGGAFLCYEGAHKVHQKLFRSEVDKQEKEELKKALRDPEVDLVAFENKKIKGAIRTDFILSAEIIVIALGSVAAATLSVQLGVLIAISALVVLVVYGLVGGGIFSHNIPWVEHPFKGWAALTGPLESVTPLLLDGLLGVAIGAIIVAILSLGSRLAN
ncbi:MULTISPECIES: DUF808 family protein, partial [unclassified Wenzhouxiangella]|uniref:DUF808 family protein n=1 Tax=unclassified Wenzhouxiangella TaxID=2613841 RepID=UPI000E32B236